MKDRELRLGNIISYRGEKWAIVSSLGSYGFETVNNYDCMPIGSDDVNEYEPILLTKDTLNKTPFEFSHCEFVRIDGLIPVYALGRLSLGLLADNRSAIYFDGKLFCYIPSNLHSLQNFYFATMHEELTINR